MVKNGEFFVIKEMRLKGMSITQIAERWDGIEKRFENGS
jgi:hypothetical protein